MPAAVPVLDRRGGDEPGHDRGDEEGDEDVVGLEELRGEAAPEKRWNPSEHNQKGTGRFESEQ